MSREMLLILINETDASVSTRKIEFELDAFVLIMTKSDKLLFMRKIWCSGVPISTDSARRSPGEFRFPSSNVFQLDWNYDWNYCRCNNYRYNSDFDYYCGHDYSIGYY